MAIISHVIHGVGIFRRLPIAENVPGCGPDNPFEFRMIGDARVDLGNDNALAAARPALALRIPPGSPESNPRQRPGLIAFDGRLGADPATREFIR